MRQNPELVPLGVCITSSYHDGNLTSYSEIPTSTHGQYLWNRGYSSVNTPGFHNLRRLKRPLPFNSHSVTGMMNEQGGWSSHSSHWGYNERGIRVQLDSDSSSVSKIAVYASGINADYYPLAGARSQAENRLREMVGGLTANMAQAFAERQQTARLIENSVNRVLRVGRALRHGNLKQVRSCLGLLPTAPVYNRFGRKIRDGVPNSDVGSLFLEYKYGWSPLMQDVYGSIDLLTKKITANEGLSVRTAGKAYETTGRDDSLLPRWSAVKSTVARLGFNIHCQSELVALAGQTGISNPALLGWELVPFSFVVDWFLPVGNFLEGLSAYDGFNLSNGWMSERTTFTYLGGYGSSTWNGNYFHLMTSGVRKARGFSYYRTTIASPPLEVPSLRSPLNLKNSADRVATSLSLLTSLAKGSPAKPRLRGF